MESFTRQDIPASLTLSQFSAYISQAISRHPALCGSWVTAEISDLIVRGGHCYMTLIEKDDTGTTIARMRATIWANRFVEISRDFRKATERDLANGMKVMFYGAANYHGNYGLSFNIGGINPSYTMGDLERIRREILAALQREGVIDMNRRLRITEPPQRIAVISSATAAGYGDFANQLLGNPIGAEFYTLLFPAIMQGERTAPSVIEALRQVREKSSIIPWDCVVIIRGGGATTDMNGFDDLRLAREVATFPIPVIVGIGHERDRCVLDEIACVRCKTPTAVAAYLSDAVAGAWQRSADLATRIATYASERLKGEQIRLQGLQTMVPALAETRISNARLRLHNISATLPGIAQEATSKEKIRLENAAATLKVLSQSKIEKSNDYLDNIAANLRRASATTIERETAKLDSIGTLVSVLDPRSTLKRGYSITRANGKAVTDPTSLKEGDTLVTTTAGGTITSHVSVSAQH